MRSITFTDVERLEPRAGEDEVVLHMDDEAFRGFYDRTARIVWSYLARLSGDRQLADDLLQETYYRFLRTDRAFTSEAHRRNYLFRIATNLVHDHRRRTRVDLVHVPEEDEPGAMTADGDVAVDAVRRTDLSRAMAQLRPRERSLLWLAYAQGASHLEIAEALGLRTASIKSLLFRARRRLVTLLGPGASR